MIGSRLNHYQIGALLGEGGMGRVYRATDTRLNRDVALKVLPDDLVSDADRASRFKREAQVLASLNHPNVAAIYGLEEEGSSARALVMELVEGDTLADRLANGALPIDDAIAVARQLADAIEYAHDQGVIHRDLKPANIKITPNGTVKVLDFGLAKALDTAEGKRQAADRSANSPTMSLAATQAGLILGTAAYMSPEQAKGKPADRRADIWAFGIVLFEMLTGRAVYAGETISETMAHVITKEPDWTALPASTPNRVRDLLQRCLVKDPRRRLQAIGDARIVLEEVTGADSTAAGQTESARQAVMPTRRREVIWASLASAALVGVAAMAMRERFRPAPEIHPVRFEVSTPEQGVPQFPQGSAVISPDGLKLAFAGMSGEKRLLWVHNLEAGTAMPLENTEGIAPAILMWSPDSRYIAFSTLDRLRKIAATGGPSQVISQLPNGFRTAAWSTEDVIVFGGSPMSRVSAAGGDLVPLTVPGVPANVGGQGFPSFLPDGRHYFYLARQGGQNVAYVAALDSSAPVPLPGVTSEVKYSAGHILFLRDGVLMAQRFDVDRLQLSGEAFTIADLVAPRNAVAGPFSVSDGGTLAYRRSEFQGESRLVWLDRSGREVGVAAGVGDYDDLELSPDENFVAFESTTGLGGSSSDAGDIFVLDLVRGVTSRVTSDPQRDADPLWSPDGKTIVFRGDRDGGHLYARAFGVVGEDRLLLKGQSREEPDHWSPDGRYITYQSRGDIWALPMAGEQRPIQITNSPASDQEGRVSPDGHWIAYQSNEPGVTEVFIQSFPDARAKRQVSTGGGSEPRWSHDGRELYYVSGDFTLMAVTVKASGDSLAIGVPEKLFPASAARGEGNYAVSKTGRFLMRSPMLSRTTPNITVILNWAAGLPR